MKLNLQDTFTKELPADPILKNERRQVSNACFSFVEPRKTSQPNLIHVSMEMAEALGFTKEDVASDEFRDIVTGNVLLEGTKSYAMCYGGHQFGHWAGQLGDGRAINIAEIVHDDKRWALQIKGSGETPYSRNADGLAVLRSSIREYLCSEAMYHLGVPTTRALSLSLTGDEVLRDMLYDGNSAMEPGAIVCRVAPSFIRFGSFEILAARENFEELKQLADYTIKHFYPTIKTAGKQAYLDLLEGVCDRSLDMVVEWQRVGFVHGVMNTDNMSILGLTIDYGPYGWLDNYDMGWTPNTTDKQHKRYRFGSQPEIVLWNLHKLANTFYPLIKEVEPLEEILNSFIQKYKQAYLTMMRTKLGLTAKTNADFVLIKDLEEHLHLTETDMTIFYRKLSSFKRTEPSNWFEIVRDAFYLPKEIKKNTKKKWTTWFADYAARLTEEQASDEERKVNMDAVNPKYVLRNYMAQIAIDAAHKEDYSVIEELFELLKKPYDEQLDMEKWFVKRPDWARSKIGCSMLSCSS